jgi:hypothetical protein
VTEDELARQFRELPSPMMTRPGRAHGIIAETRRRRVWTAAGVSAVVAVVAGSFVLFAGTGGRTGLGPAASPTPQATAATSASSASPAPAPAAGITETIQAGALPVCGVLPLSDGPSRTVLSVTLTGAHTAPAGSSISLGVVARSLTGKTQRLATGNSVDVLIMRDGKVIGRYPGASAPDSVGISQVGKPVLLSAPGVYKVYSPTVLLSGCARGTISATDPDASRVPLPPGQYTLIGVLTDNPKDGQVPVLDTQPFPLTVTAAAGAAPTTPTVVTVAAHAATARAVCESVLGHVDTASPGTVGDVRDLRIGPDSAPAPHAFPNAPASETVAWCWVRDTAQRVDVAWAVHPGDPPVQVGGIGWTTQTGPGPVPSGEPMEG